MQNFIINKSDIIKIIFRFILIILLCFLTVTILLSIAAIIISCINFSYEILSPLTALILGISAAIDGFLISRWNKENGLFWGILSAVVIISFMFIISFYYSSFSFSSLLFTKSAIVLTTGAISGILGVNIN